MSKEKKTMDIRGELIGYDGDNAMIRLLDEIDEKAIKRLQVDGRTFLYMDIHDNRNISDAQRNYFWALMGDFEEYTGYPQRTAGDWFRLKFMRGKGLPHFPSVARGQMTMKTARSLLQYILEYFIEHSIPFKDQKFYLAQDESELFYGLTMNRICWLCGKENSELAHYEAVGAGRDRTKIDHTKHHFMMLCYDHHQQQHQMGASNFCELHHITPIKLNKEDLQELNIQGNYEE